MSIGLRVEAEIRLPAFHLRAAFTAPPGLTVLFGPSGAGKSLALQAIAGLAPLTAGRVALGERPLEDAATGLRMPARLRRIGYVPQSYALFPHLTVADNVAYALPAPRHPWDHAARALRAARVAALLALVRLEGFERRWPRELSGGQAQRVALARALAAEPEALLLDEPLGALDAPTRTAVRDDLRAVVLGSGVPAIVVTHDLAEARALADRLVVLSAGRVMAEGAVADVLASPPTAEAALLLGWRNVVPVARVERLGDGGPRAVLSGGQTLALAVPSPHEPNAGGPVVGDVPLALALRADHLELLPEDRDPPAAHALTGALRTVTDAGAYYALAVALDGEPAGVPPLLVTCSLREWAALGMCPGARVGVRVPEGAARLVADGVGAPLAG